jgi:hypothetical protein
MHEARSPTVAWLAGLATTAVPLALVLRAVESVTLEAALVIGLGLALCAALVLVVPDEAQGDEVGGGRAAALCAGAGAGLLVAVALSLRHPYGLIQLDVCWHSAKVAVAALGHPLDDPILRTPTIYPFLFSALLALPVALGLAVATVMQAVTPVSLAFALWGAWWMAGAFVGPQRAALAQLALPLFFYYPLGAYVLLPTPFNLSIGVVLAGLGPWARGAGAGGRAPRPGRLAAAGTLLGTAGLLWYAHLLWITAAVLLWGMRRVRLARWVVVGAAVPAAVLALHVGLLAAEGNLGGAGITGDAPAELARARLGGMLRNLMSSSGHEALDRVPSWIGPLLAAALVLAFARRPARRVDANGVLRWAALTIVVCIAWGGFRLTYWEPFSWRFLFLLEALCVVFVAGARPWRVGRTSLGPVLAPVLAALVLPPWWMARMASLSDAASARQLERIGPVTEFLRASTAADEPVFASNKTWEQAIAIGAARPGFVDRNGGTYKYAPGARVAGRWRDLQALADLGDARAVAELLAPYGFRYAVVSDEDRARPGYEALARGFAAEIDAGGYRVVDLRQPR